MPSRLEGGRHRSRRAFGHTTRLWPLAAEAAYAEGLTSRLVSGEAIRRALACLGGAGSEPNTGSLFPIRCTSEKKRRDWLMAAVQGLTAALLGWDHASWHISRAVRMWLRQHNPQPVLTPYKLLYIERHSHHHAAASSNGTYKTALPIPSDTDQPLRYCNSNGKHHAVAERR